MGEEELLKQELSILLAVDHPNIVKLNEIYLDHKYIHLVTELLEGGEVNPEVMPEKRFNEATAAKIVR
jgi:serine/threonine protein kinase